jgi:hypothetical protein
MSTYQAADGRWITFDGITKQFFDTEQEARMATRPSAIVEFQEAHDRTKAQAKALLALCDEIEKMRGANPDALTIAVADLSADPTAPVGDSAMTRSEAYTACLLYDAIAAFRAQTLGATGLTVAQALYRR